MARIRWDAGKVVVRLQKLDGNIRKLLKPAALEVAGRLISHAEMEWPTVPELTGVLRKNRVMDATAQGSKATAIGGYNSPYGAVQHEGRWETGPLAGVEIKRWTTPGSGPKFLEAKLQRHRRDYLELFAKILAEKTGMD